MEVGLRLLQNYNFPIQDQQMSQALLYTPAKNRKINDKSVLQTADRSNFKPVDMNLKKKYWELYDENVQLRIMEKKYQAHNQALQYQLSQIKSQVNQFLAKSQYKSLTQATYSVKMSTIPKQVVKQQKSFHNFCQISRQTNEHYSTVIANKMQQVAHKYQQKSAQQNKEKQKIQQLSQQNSALMEENAKLKQNNYNLQQQLKNSIQRFEQIEEVIDNKMKYYIQKVKYYEEMCQNMGTLNEKQDKNVLDFSFGSDEHNRVDKKVNNADHVLEPQHNEQADINKAGAEAESLSAECYRASIQGLLDENKRLKKSFQNLYRLKQGETIPEELQKQINIMKSILELSENTEYSQYS